MKTIELNMEIGKTYIATKLYEGFKYKYNGRHIISLNAHTGGIISMESISDYMNFINSLELEEHIEYVTIEEAIKHMSAGNLCGLKGFEGVEYKTMECGTIVYRRTRNEKWIDCLLNPNFLRPDWILL